MTSPALTPYVRCSEVWAQEYTLIQSQIPSIVEEDQASLRPGCCTSGTTVLMALAP